MSRAKAVSQQVVGVGVAAAALLTAMVVGEELILNPAEYLFDVNPADLTGLLGI